MATEDDRVETTTRLRAAARAAIDALRRYVITIASGAVGLSIILAQFGDVGGRVDELLGIWIWYGVAIVIGMVSYISDAFVHSLKADAIEQGRDSNVDIRFNVALGVWMAFSAVYLGAFALATFRLMDFAISVVGD